MSKKDVQLNIRITQKLKDKIELSAKLNNRSINAEAITLIEESLARKEDIEKKVLGSSVMLDSIKNNYPEDSMEIAKKDLVTAFNVVSEIFLAQNEDKLKDLSIQTLLQVMKNREEK